MIKKVLILILAGIFLLGCGDTKAVKEDKEIGMIEENKLITVDRLKEEAGSDIDGYSDDLIMKVIKEYEITEENVGKLNIVFLLDSFNDEDVANVEGIFSEDNEARKDHFFEDIKAVAFIENIGTTVKTVYIDLEEGVKYTTELGNVLSDLNKADKEKIDTDKIVEALKESDVFSWEPKEFKEDITDPQYMKLAVEYKDGSVFSIESSGILGETLPDEYSKLRNELL